MRLLATRPVDHLQAPTISIDVSGRGVARPRFLRALGVSEPPLMVTVAEKKFVRDQIFKHDSWAATATYRSSAGETIVCKFNRQAPIGMLPLRWLGRFLARREHYFLSSLNNVAGIPQVFDAVFVNGRLMDHAVAHEFIPGLPLSLAERPSRQFFDALDKLLGKLHEKRMAYVDLHKRENVIVGDDGRPYLIDFQVSVQLPSGWIFACLFGMLRECDLYHSDKHRRECGRDQLAIHRPRPWILNLHRMIGVPLRTLRRRFLVAIGVRRGRGFSVTELEPEIGHRRSAA